MIFGPLSSLHDEAEARLARYGLNRLPEPPRQSELRRFFRQLESPLVLVLIGAAVIATVVGVTEHGSFLLRFGDALAAYRAAGATGFGLGSALYQPGRTPEDIAARARAFVVMPGMRSERDRSASAVPL